jgi:hypothetical protein
MPRTPRPTGYHSWPPMADLRACARCSGLVEGRMSLCPHCGGWLGYGRPALWCALVVGGGLLTLLAFFWPWLNVTAPSSAATLTGYDLARIAQRLVAMAAGPRPTAVASVALYLAPTSGVLMVGLVLLTPLLRLRWSFVGRLLVALAAVPGLLALLATLFTLGLLGDTGTGWPHIGLIATGLGSLAAIAGGIALGGPGRLAR